MEVLSIIFMIFAGIILLAMLGVASKIIGLFFNIFFGIIGVVFKLAGDGIGCLIVIGIIIFLMMAIAGA